MQNQCDYQDMSLEQARKVAWRSPNQNKSLGELYDIGFLTIEILQRECQKNVDEYIRNACNVLLEKKLDDAKCAMRKGGLPTCYEEARFVVCPHTYFLRNFKGIDFEIDYGTLLDNNILDENDLRIQCNPRACRQYTEPSAAAALFMLADLQNKRLRISNSEYGPLKVSSNVSFIERQKEHLALNKGMWLGASLAVAFFLLLADVVYLIIKNPIHELLQLNAFLIAMSVFIVVCACCFIMFLMNKTFFKFWDRKIDSYDEEIAYYRKGKEGEDHVVDIMRCCLDGRFHVFRNLEIPKAKNGDVDCVLVTPQEVIAFEIKNTLGDYYVEKKKWKCYSNGKLMRSQPVKQSITNAAILANYLEPLYREHCVHKWVKSVVVLANPNSSCKFNDDNTEVWKIEELQEKLSALTRFENANPTFANAVCERLSGLYKKD